MEVRLAEDGAMVTRVGTTGTGGCGGGCVGGCGGGCVGGCGGGCVGGCGGGFDVVGLSLPQVTSASKTRQEIRNGKIRDCFIELGTS